ncbi:4-hydroxy-tetrahydrodipicolinate synthase 2 [Microlunatus endophyticus]|uniref:4-hydroxy-tetrahydrodipicolinate synthase n=1 Tax=Microlunatus endophyticus TaxID=1716077 RepID=A0A917RZT0_9ACTN|nr:4-hydroxy-tetrahydrodipicolinate synthase [Microlunatus endophyticus]GGL47531.1 4-hydroxy-tetrahydrodipicolinate synthase 2 [Microlunatus endophyticus]
MIFTEGPLFGRLLTAMVTPFDKDLAVDLGVAADLARYLVDDLGNDGLVINGTTGEAPTTTDEEKAAVVAAVVAAVGDRASVLAGVGTFDTRHTVDALQAARQAGADGALVVTPYYNRPPQSGLIRHFTAIADASELPIMIYDIPKRTGTPVETPTMIELAAHPRIVAVKDAKGDLSASSEVLAATDLLYYAGDDAMTLPLLAIGGVGVVGTSTHFSGRGMKQLIQAFLDGKNDEASRLHQQLMPIFTGVFATQGCILVKAGLALQGHAVGGLRSPMVEATDQQRAALQQALSTAGL